jgi:hypothetical protein
MDYNEEQKDAVRGTWITISLIIGISIILFVTINTF